MDYTALFAKSSAIIVTTMRVNTKDNAANVQHCFDLDTSC